MTDEIKKVVEDFRTKSFVPLMDEYFERDPEHKFFELFIDRFPTELSFKEALRDGYEYEDDDSDDDLEDGEEGMTEEQMDEKYWSPELEVYTIESCIDSYPGIELWVDFYNALVENNW